MIIDIWTFLSTVITLLLLTLWKGPIDLITSIFLSRILFLSVILPSKDVSVDDINDNVKGEVAFKTINIPSAPVNRSSQEYKTVARELSGPFFKSLGLDSDLHLIWMKLTDRSALFMLDSTKRFVFLSKMVKVLVVDVGTTKPSRTLKVNVTTFSRQRLRVQQYVRTLAAVLVFYLSASASVRDAIFDFIQNNILKFNS